MLLIHTFMKAACMLMIFLIVLISASEQPDNGGSLVSDNNSYMLIERNTDSESNSIVLENGENSERQIVDSQGTDNRASRTRQESCSLGHYRLFHPLHQSFQTIGLILVFLI